MEEIKAGFFRVTYVLQIDALDNVLGNAIMTISDFDKLVAEASTVSQDADTGIVTMTGETLDVELNPYTLEATVKRIR